MCCSTASSLCARTCTTAAFSISSSASSLQHFPIIASFRHFCKARVAAQVRMDDRQGPVRGCSDITRTQSSGQGTEGESMTMQGCVGEAFATMVPSDVSHAYLNAMSGAFFLKLHLCPRKTYLGMGNSRNVDLLYAWYSSSLPQRSFACSERPTSVRYLAPPPEQLARDTEARGGT